MPPFSAHALFRVVIVLLFAATSALGCAEGGSVIESGSDAGSDAGDDTGVGPTDSAMPEDSGPETDTNPCGTCCPGETACIDETTAGTCNASGDDFEPNPCAEGDTCSEGVCSTPPVCTPGETSCFDATTVLTCRASGEGFTTTPCSGDTVCFDGACVTGSATGTPCTTDDDCASGECHCGSGTDEACPPNATPGYCTQPCTNDDECGADAHCVLGDLTPLGTPNANYDHCAPSCQAVCLQEEFSCIQVPHQQADGTIGWDDTCYFPEIAEIGQPCASDDKCVGECLEDYVDDGYCTRRCDADASCPDGSACVELRPGEFWCSLLCGDGSVIGTGECPRDVPVEQFDITCKRLSTSEGDRVFRACAATSS